ncbi:MAG TPA: FtsX-like permease family protein, partial [Chitinophagales bacterium]|nr:FtsX-like permease family protein [Chitinophagales bacterium]
LFMLSFAYGISSQRLRAVLASQISHAQIHYPQFNDDYEINLFISDTGEVLEALRGEQKVKSFSGRVVATGLITTSITGSGVIIKGINPDEEKRVTNIHEKIVKGSFFTEGKKNQIIIGEKLAQKLQADLKKSVVLKMIDLNGNIVDESFRIAGIYKTSSAKFDETHVFVRRESLAEALGIGSSLHEIALLLNHEDEIDAFKTAMQQKLPELSVESWKDIAPELDYINRFMDEYLRIFMAVILFAMAFGIINTMLMAVLERTREIGMLMAIGMNKQKLFFMILLETVFLTFAGVPFGLLLSIITIRLLNKTGVDLSIFSRGLENFDIETVVYPTLDTSFYPTLMMMVAATAILSSLYPAYKALRLHPASAIRSV